LQDFKYVHSMVLSECAVYLAGHPPTQTSAAHLSAATMWRMILQGIVAGNCHPVAPECWKLPSRRYPVVHLQEFMRAHTTVLPEGAVLVADQQTRGKGRGGNVWTSPDGCLMFTAMRRLQVRCGAAAAAAAAAAAVAAAAAGYAT
jgi:hypothetical protein